MPAAVWWGVQQEWEEYEGKVQSINSPPPSIPAQIPECCNAQFNYLHAACLAALTILPIFNIAIFEFCSLLAENLIDYT